MTWIASSWIAAAVHLRRARSSWSRFANIPVQVKAGAHEVVVTFIERSRVATDDLIVSGTQYHGFLIKGYMRLPRLMGSIKLAGPYAATSPTRTPSREKLLGICKPETPEQERACAQRIATDLAGRAFRRPVNKDDVAGLMTFYDTGREGAGGFNAGIEQLVSCNSQVSPDFLYRGISPKREGARGHEIPCIRAIWSWLRVCLSSCRQRAPDDELLEACTEQGRTAAIPAIPGRAQVRRMLAAPEAETLVTDFAFRWLDLLEVTKFEWDKQIFPEFSAELRQDMSTEIDLFLRDIMLGDKNVEGLLTADSTFLNEKASAALRHHDGARRAVPPRPS